ncbi:MAG TPA: head GIN domain-containing protein [Hanamia sp.]
MKKLLIAFFVFISINSFAQRWETIKGNGQVKKENRTVSNFTALSSQGAMNVQIAYGNSDNIVVEADENLLPYIETSVENGKLSIRSKKNVNLKPKSKMSVYVTMTRITALQQSGSGNINGNGAFTNDAKTDISLSGSGNIKLGFDTFKDIELALSGSGNIELKGNTTNSITASISGSGNIDCSGITSNEVQAKISGSGNIKVYAKNSLDSKISGSGNVFYKGSPTNVTSKTGGSGKVIKM